MKSSQDKINIKPKNYTSTMSAEKSVARIEKCLVTHGAKNILKDYDSQGNLSGIVFVMQIGEKQIPFKLPARIDAAQNKLLELIKRPKKGTILRIQEQAKRTAWKVLCDWIESQMTLIMFNQAEFIQTFLSYAYDPANQQTFFEKLKKTNFKLLPEYTEQEIDKK